MCGICGMAGCVDAELLARMTEIIRHRGPDDGGTFVSDDGCAGLGNRRLAIIDLSPAGHMPMRTPDGALSITYNGEVYNFHELRDALEQRGYRFRSGSDTEVVLYAYDAYGVESFRRLNGMFALAIWDARRRELVLARDRFGVKPLYYAQIGDDLVFGSEVKSLLLDPRVPRALDPEGLHFFLSHLWVPGPGSIFTGVRKLQPGHVLRWRDGRVTVEPYWEIAWPEDARESAGDLARELRVLLERAVERHLIADVPLGLFLSGGLDSTTLLALATRLTGAPVDAYTIAFRGEDARLEQAGGEDERYAERAAQHFDARFHRIQVDPDIVNLLPRVLWHLDIPIADPAAIATLLIAQAARPDVTVLLSGQGADEVFGGYRVHLGDRFARPVALLPGAVRRGVLAPALAALRANAEYIPGVHPGLALAAHRYFDKVLAGAALSPEERYIFNRSYYTQDELLALYAPERRAQMAAFDGGARHRAYFAEVPHAHFVNRMLHVDLKTFLPELNLAYGDKLSMAASVEMRVPFLDYAVVDFMTRVPAGMKIRGLTGKWLLRRAVADIVPAEVLRRRKAGFGAPIRRWLGHELAPLLGDLLSVETVRARGLFDPAAVRGLVERHRSGAEDNTYRLWALLTLELWQRMFIDQTLKP
jgi:asparagine synthase (glutamine-hydrolysing)